ncbi:hemagglutinin repeat-containing protein [Vibrio caribbeanicus]|uniref:Filamentous hemagglutinin outer membrane protein n=1 Tax=Vibrio caribbeanicus ATCC BAA-2122 TaxID=796620 RepID=E3BH38_9VIBR|nr:hemagglutinin repeat-containing protein [Vibrio caribbeanicus]EFP97675.1 filamentous hemagglutinin outer membrane protein [Vibrio caribbeanicus ATCC BAA-2122]
MKFKLSCQGILKYSIAVALCSLPVGAMANGGIQTSGSTNTQVDHVGNTPVVNIAKPEGGISHNQYNQYNVTSAGAVLNNSTQGQLQSQLLQQLIASNPNLTEGAASVILNEVISQNPSLLNGAQEILGQSADLILANPNGITCSGCEFINTNAASLVVGKVDFTKSGLKYNTFKNQNRLSITENGVRGSETLNLIAPSINADGPVQANQNINAIAGNNIVDQKTLAVEETEQSSESLIDSYFLGGMVSGRIQLVSTHAGSGVNISGKVKGSDIDLNAKGDLRLNAASVGDKSTERVNLVGKNVDSSGNITTTTSTVKDGDNRDGFLRHNKYGETKTSTEKIERSSISGKNINIGAREGAFLKATQVSGDQVAISGKNVDLSDQKITQTTDRTNNNWYLSWRSDYNKQTTEQTSVGTEINAKENITINATGGDVTVKGSQLNASQNANVSAQGDVKLLGSITQNSTQESGYKRNDGAELKTGSWKEGNTVETSNASSINAGQNVNISAKNNVTTRNAQLTANDVNISAGQTVSIGADKTTNTGVSQNDKTYWGGIGGGNNKNVKDSKQTAAGSRVNAKNDLEVKGKDLEITGSEAIGKKAAHVEADRVKIDGAVTQDTESNNTRQGTVFNITKDSNNTKTTQQNVTSSEVLSNTNLRVRGHESVEISGSNVSANDKLDISSNGNVTVSGQAAEGSSTVDTTSLGVNFYAKEKSDKQYAAGVRVEHNSTGKTQTSTSHTASNIKAGNITISSGSTATVAGSNIDAKQDVSITGKDVNVISSHDKSKETTNSTTVGGGFYYTGGIDKLGSGYEGSVDTNNTTVNTSTANTSSIKSGGNTNINATNKISNEGTAFDANGDLNLQAKQIDNKAAVSSRTETTDKVSVGVDIGANVDYSNISRPVEQGVKKVTEGGITAVPGAISETAQSIDTPNLGVDLDVGVSNGTETKAQTTSQVSSIKAGSININAEKSVTDQGTQYQAKNGVNINTKQYQNTAAVNTQTETKNITDGTGNLRVYTTTGADVTGDGKGEGGNTQETKSSEKAIVSNITAGNGVSITANDGIELTGTNIDAGSGKAELTANNGNVTINQATDKQSESSTSYRANLGLKAGYSAEKTNFGGSGGGSYESNEKSDTQAITSTVAGKNGVSVTAGKDVNLQGTNIVAGDTGNVDINAGNKVNFQQAESSSTSSKREYSGQLELNQSKADSGKSKTYGGKVSGAYVTNDKSSTTGQAGSIQGANNVTVNAGEDIYLQGTQIGDKDQKVGNVALNAGGDIKLDAQKSTSSQSGLSIKGKINATQGNVDNTEAKTASKGAGGSLEVDYIDESKSEQKGGVIASSGNVSLDAKGQQGIEMTGTKVSSQSTQLSAENGKITAQSAQTIEKRNNYSGNLNVDANRTKDLNNSGNILSSATGVEAGLKVDYKDGVTNDNAVVQGQNVSASSKGNVTLSGANIQADSVDIKSREGGLVVESRQNKDVSVDLEFGGKASKSVQPASKSQYDQLKETVNGLPGGDKTKPYKEKITNYTDEKLGKAKEKYSSLKDDAIDKYKKTADKVDSDWENKAHEPRWWDKAARKIGGEVDNKVKGLYTTGSEPVKNSGVEATKPFSLKVTDKVSVEQQSGISGTNGVSIDTAAPTQLKGAVVESKQGTVDTGSQNVVTEEISNKNNSFRADIKNDGIENIKQAVSDIKQGQTPLIGIKIDSSKTEGGVKQAAPADSE